MPAHARITGRFSLFASIAIAVASASAAASITRRAEPFEGVTHWQVIESKDASIGNDPASFKLERPTVVNILEIDTRAPGIRFEMSPGNGDAPGEIKRGTTRAFVDSINAQIGVNVGFYDTRANYGDLNTDLMHLAASKGEVYSPAGGNEYVFDVGQNNRARIRRADGKDATTIANKSPVYNAAGGNQPMLRDGQVVTPDGAYTTTLNPHTAVGVSRDGRRVFLVVVDGRQSGYAEGMRTDEMARLMLKFGAWDAINWDGGGSTTMVMDDTDDGTQNARLVNSPSDNSTPAKPGTDRVVANSFAVFAKPKSGYTPLGPIPRPTLRDALELIKTRYVIDDFEGGKLGHFAGPVLASGSTRGVDERSSVAIDATHKKQGEASMKLSIVASAAKPNEPLMLRLLSGDASPKTNALDGKAMGNDGFVGVYLRREAGGPPLFVSLVVDEGTPDAVSTERGRAFEVTADGEWHLYQWGLNEDARWINYNGGNGRIDGPNVFVDSLLFHTADGDQAGTPFTGDVWIDAMTYSPDDRIAE